MIYDNFYNEKDWTRVNELVKKMNFTATHQPTTSYSIDNRLKGYPCYETWPEDNEEDLKELKDILKKTVEEKTGWKIKSVNTAFRKIYSDELKQSPFHNGESSIHRDFDCDKAGVVYFDGLTIKGGTSVFFDQQDGEQFEPDVVYGARPNRAVLYDSHVLHRANHDFAYKVRTIQTIFIKLDK